MKLVLSVILSSILGLILFLLGIPGVVIAFGIIAGSLFYGLYLLLSMREKLTSVVKHLDIKEEEVPQLSNEEIERDLEDGFEK